MYTKDFWRATAVRVVRSFFLTLATLLTTGATMREINWIVILSSCGVMAIYTFALCMAGIPEVEKPVPTDISPTIENEELIDTAKEDAKLQGNPLPDHLERGEG